MIEYYRPGASNASMNIQGGRLSYSIIRKIAIILLVVLPVILVTLGTETYIHGQAATSFLFFLLTSISMHFVRPANMTARFILYIAFQGFIVGLFFVVIGLNDFTQFVVYSGLAMLLYFSFQVGRCFYSTSFLLDFILILGAADTLASIPLILDGSAYRTSIGSTNLLPALIVLSVYRKSLFKSKTKRIVLLFELLVAVISYFLSGLRSALGVGAISIAILILYSLKNARFSRQGLKAVLGMLIIFSIGYVMLPKSLKTVAVSRVELVAFRFSNTLLNPAGMKFDENDEISRKVEGLSAVEEFDNTRTGTPYLLGRGHGFTFKSKYADKYSAHMHISFFAFYTKYGIVGVLFYLYLFIVVLYTCLKCLRQRYCIQNILALGIALSAVQVMLISIISASLTNSINGCILGLCSGVVMVHRDRKSVAIYREMK